MNKILYVFVDSSKSKIFFYIFFTVGNDFKSIISLKYQIKNFWTHLTLAYFLIFLFFSFYELF